MKKIVSLLIALTLLFALASCGAPSQTGKDTGTDSAPDTADTPKESGAAEPEDTSPAEAETVPEETSEESDAGRDVLVVFFSATGTTKGVAEKIARIEDADLYEIRAEVEYTAADLDWNDRDSRTTIEQNDKSARPAIGSERISLDGYEKIYVGFPIWWGEEPRIMDTFVESYDFDGITVIPFCTSGGSGIGRSGENLAELAKSGVWLEGRRLSAGVSDEEISSWIDSLK